MYLQELEAFLLAYLVALKGVEWREVEDKDKGPSLCHNHLQHESCTAEQPSHGSRQSVAA